MKRLYKIIIFFVLHISLMLLLPFLIVKLAPASAGMGICMILFFAVYPIFSMALGFVATKDMKLLGLLPLVNAICFPLLFSLAMGKMIAELYAYAGIYAFLGYSVLLLTLIIKKIMIERRK